MMEGMSMRLRCMYTMVLGALLLCGGCSEECASELPAIRLEVQLAGGVDGAALAKLVIRLEAGGKTRVKEAALNGALADGQTSIELVLGSFAGQGYSGTLEVRARTSAGKVAASARVAVAGAGDACNVVNITLASGDLGDGGPPQPDVAVSDGPGPDRGKPKLDRGKPKLDKGKPKLDKGTPKPDKGKPKPDQKLGVCVGKADGTACPYGKCLNSVCCTGCVKGKSCLTGTSSTSCGKGGVTCSTCTTSNPCMSPKCASTGKCTQMVKPIGSTCSGGKCANGTCCKGCITSSGGCSTGSAISSCGKGGVACKTCKANSECNDPICSSSGSCGASTSPNGKTCSTGKCYKGTCCSGCVGNYTCQSGTSTSYCGKGGNSCKKCTTTKECRKAVCYKQGCTTSAAPNGTSCSEGKCQTGICKCGSSSDCKSSKMGLVCFTISGRCGCKSSNDCLYNRKCNTKKGYCY